MSESKRLMSKLIHPYLLALALVFSVGRAVAYSELLILGDSLSDTGNHPAAILGSPYPYYQNRISNGPVAVDVLAEKLGLDASNSGYIFGNGSGGNYAVSGANAVGAEIHDLESQLSAMLEDKGGKLDPDALYLVMMGGNDLRDASVLASYALGRSAVYAAADAIRAAAQRLLNRGAKSVLISNAPDISRIPETRERATTDPGLIARASQLSGDFNARLKQQLATLTLPVGARIMHFDFYAAFNSILASPALFGFSNSRDACFEFSPYSFHPECDFEQFVFFDSIHPTAKTHRLLGEGLTEVALTPVSTPFIPAVLNLLLLD